MIPQNSHFHWTSFWGQVNGCSREYWIVSACYRRRQAEGMYNHDLAKMESTLQGVALSSIFIG